MISFLSARVEYGATLYTWAQLLIFLDFSKNNSPHIQRSDGSDVHSANSFITSQPWINNLCSYETGRHVLLHFTDGNHKAERLNVLNVPKEELWTRANIQIVLAYVLSTRTHCILNYSVAVLLTTSCTGTSSLIKYSGWEGEKCSVAGMSSSDKMDTWNESLRLGPVVTLNKLPPSVEQKITKFQFY